METRWEDRAEALLSEPYAVIDSLPMQVPADSAGQYFAVERWMQQPQQKEPLFRKLAAILLRLNCYFDFRVCRDCSGEWESNPDPETLANWFVACANAEQPGSHRLLVLLDSQNALFAVDGDDVYMVLYHPSEQLLRLTEQISTAEGLFVWRHENGAEQESIEHTS